MTDTYDIIVFGATGFVGQLICEELVTYCADTANVRWAVAGRDNTKLKTLLSKLAVETGHAFVKKTPIVLANLDDNNSILEMARQTKILINCVGPFILYGDQVVKACITACTHHLDISGESYYLELMHLKYGDIAKENGVYVIGSLGYESVAAEMGLKYTVNHFPMRLNDIEAFIEFRGQGSPKINYGSYDSFLTSTSHANDLIEIRKKLFPQLLPRPLCLQKSRGSLFYEPTVKRWCVPFPGPDRAVVLRSQQQLYWSKEITNVIQFRPYLCVKSWFFGWLLLMAGFILGFLTYFSCTRALMRRFYRLFSLNLVSKEGPPKEALYNSFFSITFIGRGHNMRACLKESQTEIPTDTTLVTRLTGPNAAYVTSSKCIVQAALTVLHESDSMPSEGGVYAPGAAFWNTGFYKRLEEQGFMLETIANEGTVVEKKEN